MASSVKGAASPSPPQTSATRWLFGPPFTLENVSYILRRPDFADLGPVKFFILRGDETLYGYLPVVPAKTAQR